MASIQWVMLIVGPLLLSTSDAAAGVKDNLIQSIMLLKAKTETGVTVTELSSATADVSAHSELSTLNGDAKKAVDQLLISARKAIDIMTDHDTAATLLYVCVIDQNGAAAASNAPNGAACRTRFAGLTRELGVSYRPSDNELDMMVTAGPDLVKRVADRLALTAIRNRAVTAINLLRRQ